MSNPTGINGNDHFVCPVCGTTCPANKATCGHKECEKRFWDRLEINPRLVVLPRCSESMRKNSNWHRRHAVGTLQNTHDVAHNLCEEV